jgi:hypothetical protein
MQQVLPKWMWTFGLALFAIVVLSASEVLSFTNLDLPPMRLASSVASGAILLFTLLFAGRGRRAAWRVVWRTFPQLNSLIYPDLNGVWVGVGRSNWTAIEKLRTAAASSEKINLDDLFDLERQESPIVLQIKCNLFGIQIVSHQANTESKSTSLSCGIERDEKSEVYLLNYTYRQVNSIVSATDSENHIGAAILEIEYADLLNAAGSYWTKRCWEDGRNTAGSIDLHKVSDESNLSAQQLKEYFRS